MSRENRVPAGAPAGGQFAATTRPESGVTLSPEPGFGDGVSNPALASQVHALMKSEGISENVRAEDGYFPGSLRIRGAYEGELLHLAETCAHDGLYVDLKNGSDVYGDPTDGFEFSVAEHDEYGSHNTWLTGEDVGY